MDIDVKERKIEGLGSCGHIINKGQKYLVENGSYYGHPKDKSYCRNCGKKYLAEQLKLMLVVAKELEMEDIFAEVLEQSMLKGLRK